MYPELEIDLRGIVSNALSMKSICRENGIKLSLVTKCLVSDKTVVNALTDAGIDAICESRIQNLADYEDVKAEKWLIREPMLCEIPLVVKYADASVNSEQKTLKALNDEAKKQGKIHKVILMYELGDLREGADAAEIEILADAVIKSDNLQLYGIGSNLSCYGSVMPGDENMKELSDLAKHLEKKFDIKLDIVSGGNSTSFEMLKAGTLPPGINNLRMGESVFLGNVPCIEKPIQDFSRSSFVLRAQIVEIKEKPSVPRGEMGFADAFGEAPPEFEDRGIRKRALIGLGKQDININGLTPRDAHIEIMGGSSDYTILDITDCKTDYSVGDVVEFDINYAVLLGSMSSRFINKKYTT